MPVRSAWLINRTETESGQSRTDTRLAPLGTMAPTDGLSTLSGIIPGSPGGKHRMSGLYVFGENTGMTATVAPGRAVIQGSEAAGAYPVVLTDYTTVTFADGDAANPRIDLVVLRVYDAQFDSGNGRTEAVLEVVQGEPSGTPQPPALPPTSLPLARVEVPAGASVGNNGIRWDTAVDDLREAAVAVGGILPETHNRDIAGGYPGQYRDTGTQLQRWDGSRWTVYPRHVGGIAPQGALATGEYTGQYRDEGGRLQRWDGQGWRPAVAVPPTVFASDTDGGYSASTTWTEALETGTTTVPKVTTSFTAPVSGAVLVTLGFLGNAGVDGQTARMSVSIRKNGSVLVEPHEARSAVTTCNRASSVSYTFRITGLEPGVAHNATLAYQSSAASSRNWYDSRFLRIDPWL
ncbi:hypothetical protein ABTY20_04925 [Streptomyces sp. NPDC126497]|uniref:hypothetical protein n=1 Tax=Streptomyces sp. NPDC126497 TaxID=3155313 RepID=UPI0033298290